MSAAWLGTSGKSVAADAPSLGAVCPSATSSACSLLLRACRPPPPPPSPPPVTAVVLGSRVRRDVLRVAIPVDLLAPTTPTTTGESGESAARLREEGMQEEEEEEGYRAISNRASD